MKKPKSNIEWEKWGEIDPFFGVASWTGKNKNGPSPWRADEFYKLGESDWEDFFDIWKKLGLKSGNCLEFGCGAGRITLPISKFFNKVYAVDVSEGMIKKVKELNLPNVELLKINSTKIPLENNSVDNVFSTHVFQHFDSVEVAKEYFIEFYRILREGGTIFVHLPIYTWPQYKNLFNSIYNTVKLIGKMKADIKRFLLRFNIGKPIMRGLFYDYKILIKDLEEIGFKDIKICIICVKSNNDIHPIVYANK